MNLRTTLPMLACAPLFTACVNYHYMPSGAQATLFREQGEVRGEFGLGGDTEGFASSFDAHLAFTLDQRWAMQFNMLYWGSSNAGGQIDLALGRYRPVGGHGSFELYGGLGYGWANDMYDGTALSNYFKTHLQPSFGYTSRNFEAAALTRFALVHHSVALGNPNERRVRDSEDVAGSRLLVEPGFMLRAGGGRVKLQVSYIHTYNAGQALSMVVDNCSLGLQFNLGRKASFPGKPRRITAPGFGA